MFGIGFNEIIIILVIALIVIGPKKLPDIAKALGKGYREFKTAFDDVKNDLDMELDDKTYDEIRKTGGNENADTDKSTDKPQTEKISKEKETDKEES